MLVHGDRAFQFLLGTDNKAYVRNSLDGEQWSGWTTLTGHLHAKDFAVGAIADRLVLSVRGDDNRLYTRSAAEGLHWGGWEVGDSTLDLPSLEVVGDRLVQSYQTLDGRVLTRDSSDGENWSEWDDRQTVALEWRKQQKAQIDPVLDATTSAIAPAFTSSHPDNGTAIHAIVPETNRGRSTYQPLYETTKAKQAENAAAAAAALAQADWYEAQVALHKERSEELGPDKQAATWTEYRRVKYRGRSGKVRKKTVEIVHVNHDWIAWDNYTKLAADFRQQAAESLQEVENERLELERWEPLAEDWSAANEAANGAEPPIVEARESIERIEADRESLPADRARLTALETLLPNLEQQFAAAQQEADAANAKALQEWLDYDADAAAYGSAIVATLERRGELDRQAQVLQLELVEVERWVEGQSVALETERGQAIALRDRLQAQLDAIVVQAALATGTELLELQAKQAQLAEGLRLATNKATVLTEQQTALTQKRSLLAAQNEVVVAEQRLAEDAQASSEAISEPLRELQADLLAQNDEHLQAAQEQQEILSALVEATQLKTNYPSFVTIHELN